MDMRIFQVKSNKALPHTGSILIASPLLYDYHFARSVVLMITHNSEGSMGIVMNKDFRYHISLNQLVPNLETAPLIPVYKGGPVDRSTIFFLHTTRFGGFISSRQWSVLKWWLRTRAAIYTGRKSHRRTYPLLCGIRRMEQHTTSKRDKRGFVDHRRNLQAALAGGELSGAIANQHERAGQSLSLVG